MKEDALSLGPEHLKYFRYLPDDAEPTAVVHVVHGVAEHAARYRRLAEALVGEGWAVYSPDHRGHGHTAGADGVLGFFGDADGWAKVVTDLRDFIRHEHEAHPRLPIVLVGHSMGSFVVRDYVARYEGGDVAAIALSGTAGPPPPIAVLGRLIARIERLRLGRRGQSTLIDKLAFGAYNKPFEPARTPFDWLSRDGTEVDKYVEDPWCGFLATTQLWIDMLDALPGLTRPKNVARIPKGLPIYLFSGASDPVGLNGKGVTALADVYRQQGLSDVTVKLYPEARHEVLNETNRDEVTRDLVAWLKTKLAAHAASNTETGRATA